MPPDYYNIEIKHRFLNELGNQDSVEQFRVLFNASSDMEYRLAKEIVFFNDSDFNNLFTQQEWTTNSSILNKKSLIRKYIQWYSRSGLPNWDLIVPAYINSVTQKSIEHDRVFEREWFASPQEVAQLFDDIDEKNVDGISYHDIRALIWLVFYGYTYEEALAIPKSSVNESEGIISYNDKIIRPCSSAMESLIEYKNSRLCVIKKKYLATVTYVQSDRLFRTHLKDSVDPAAFKVTINKFNKKLLELAIQKQIKINCIYWSGIFCRTFDYETQHGEIAAGDLETLKRVFQFDSDTDRNTYTNRLKDYRVFRTHIVCKIN